MIPAVPLILAAAGFRMLWNAHLTLGMWLGDYRPVGWQPKFASTAMRACLIEGILGVALVGLAAMGVGS